MKGFLLSLVLVVLSQGLSVETMQIQGIDTAAPQEYAKNYVIILKSGETIRISQTEATILVTQMEKK